jgi:hypothetical protein
MWCLACVWIGPAVEEQPNSMQMSASGRRMKGGPALVAGRPGAGMNQARILVQQGAQAFDVPGFSRFEEPGDRRLLAFVGLHRQAGLSRVL